MQAKDHGKVRIKADFHVFLVVHLRSADINHELCSARCGQKEAREGSVTHVVVVSAYTQQQQLAVVAKQPLPVATHEQREAQCGEHMHGSKPVAVAEISPVPALVSHS